MHLRAIDFRKDWMRELFLALKQAFVSVEEKLNNIEWYDGIFAKEQIETILGIAFVAAQTYITGTISDIRAIGVGANKGNKYEMLSTGSPYVADNVTQVVLVDSIANYYKHNEEWDGWKEDNKNKRTIEILRKCGITEKTEFPCYEAATILWPEKDIYELGKLLEILVDWRGQVLNESIATNNNTH